MAYEKTIWVNNSSPKINAENLNHIENGIKNLETTINTDSNGWTVIEHDNYIEYLKKGTLTRTMNPGFWTKVDVSDLPIGFETLGNAFLTGSSIGNDGVLNSSLGATPDQSAITLQIYNPFTSSINAVFYWNARILKLKGE